MEKGYEIKVLDHGYVKFIDQMGSDEAVIEAARMSVNKGFQNWDKDAELLEYLYANRHMTPFECGGELQIEVQAPIFIFRQWHRHRTQCLCGDTDIFFEKKDRYNKKQRGVYKLTLKDLYNKWQPTACKRKDKQKNSFFKRDRIKNMNIRCLNEKDNTFIYTHINDVIFSGEKDVFEIELESGKNIKCSADHKFLFDSGWGSLKDKMGLLLLNKKAVWNDGSYSIATNGELGYKNKDWLYEKYHVKNMTLYEIEKEYGYNYHTLRKWVRVFGLQKPHSFSKGHIPWNKDKKYKNPNFIVTEEHKEQIRQARSGSKSNWWKGGLSSDRSNIGRWTTEQANKVHKKFGYKCQLCKSLDKLVTHHIIPVWADETLAKDFNNLISVCETCHRKINGKELEYIHYFSNIDPEIYKNVRMKKSQKGVPKLINKFEKISSIRYVGKEPCYDISVDGPFHNFVANGIVTHNSFNEMSARYTKMPDEHYLPESERLTIQGKTNRQGSSNELLPLSIRNEFLDKMKEQQEDVYGFYSHSVKNKLSKEIARINCPVSRYSKMRAKTDLRNWLHFLGLRLHPHAQWEIREYAKAVSEIVKHFWPRTYELFEEHTLGAVTLSRAEVLNLKRYLLRTDDYDPNVIEKISKKLI